MLWANEYNVHACLFKFQASFQTTKSMNLLNILYAKWELFESVLSECCNLQTAKIKIGIIN